MPGGKGDGKGDTVLVVQSNLVWPVSLPSRVSGWLSKSLQWPWVMLGWYTAKRDLHLQGQCTIYSEGDVLLSKGVV